MADSNFNSYQELVNDVLDMKIGDFLTLCAENGVTISLVTSAISVCLYEIALISSFDDNK